MKSSIIASGADIEETYLLCSYLSLSGSIPQFYSMKPWEIKGKLKGFKAWVKGVFRTYE